MGDPNYVAQLRIFDDYVSKPCSRRGKTLAVMLDWFVYAVVTDRCYALPH